MIAVQLLVFTLRRSLQAISQSSNEIFVDFLKLVDCNVFEVVVLKPP